MDVLSKEKCNSILQKRGMGLFLRVGLFSGAYYINHTDAQITRVKCFSFTFKLAFHSSKVTAPQDAHGGLVLQVYLDSKLWSSVLYVGKIFVSRF